MAFRIVDRDKGYRAVVQRLGVKAGVSVGILGAKAAEEHGGMSLGAIAAIHEFGAPDAGIPERSFIRGFVDERRAEIRAVTRKLVKSVAGGSTVPQALEQLGLWLVGQIQKRIADGIPPALADATIKRKGSSTPLIDTGQLRSAISFRVEAGK